MSNVGTCTTCYRSDITVQGGVLLSHGVIGTPTCEGSGEPPQRFCDKDDEHNIVHEFDPESLLGDSYYCSKCDWWQVG